MVIKSPEKCLNSQENVAYVIIALLEGDKEQRSISGK